MKWKKFFPASLIPLNTLLLFFLVFDSWLVVPSWLQVLGRMHPVLLHFPIVLVILYAVWVLWTGRSTPSPAPLTGSARTPTPHLAAANEQVADTLLLAAAVSAAITAIMGMFLSREPGYEGASIGWHKWMGAFISFGLFGIYHFRQVLRRRTLYSGASAALIMLITLVAGHLGGTITHGENFVLGPVMPDNRRPLVPLEEAIVYKDLVSPILESKCMSCHNSSKSKGGLIMESRELLLKGGKDGKLWDTTQADLGLLMSRIHLPVEDKKHMPPTSKAQLTEEESAVLYSWIKAGAPFDKKVMDLSPTDTLRIMASGILRSTEDEQYSFAAADEKKMQALNSNYRVIRPLAKGSPALAVDFYGAPFFRPEHLKELEPVREQVVSLNLDKMPVTDNDLATIAGFANLRVLNLGFTKVTGAGVGELLKLSKLKTLTLSGTAMKLDDIRRLQTLKTLRHLYIWNIGMSPEEIASLQKGTGDPGGQSGSGTAGGNLVITTGFRTDTVLIKLNAPLLQTEERIIIQPLALQLKHYVPGVTMRYTLDGSDPDSLAPVYDGRVMLTTRALMKAKAFKKGWLSSEAVSADFYSGKYRPDSIVMLQPVDSQYMKINPKVLIDLQIGDLNFRSGKWLGFHNNRMESLLLFNSPVRAQMVTLSSVVDIGSDIMPPVTIEVWGGHDAKNLKLLGRLTPEQPKTVQIAYLAGYDIRFNPVMVKVLKVMVIPVSKLPDWQIRKGKKGWVMEDEIFVN